MKRDDGFDLFGRRFGRILRLAYAGAFAALLAKAAGAAVACVAAWRYIAGG